jgi:L-fuculose-phosphate aldolase
MIAVSGGKEIPCAKYAIFGSQQLSNNIIKSLGKQKACLISNHGLVSVGSNLKESANIAEEVEHLSQMYMEVKLHGEPNLLSDDEMNEVLVRFQSYGDWKKE